MTTSSKWNITIQLHKYMVFSAEPSITQESECKFNQGLTGAQSCLAAVMRSIEPAKEHAVKFDADVLNQLLQSRDNTVRVNLVF